MEWKCRAKGETIVQAARKQGWMTPVRMSVEEWERLLKMDESVGKSIRDPMLRKSTLTINLTGYHEIQKKDTFQKGWSLRNVKYIGN